MSRRLLVTGHQRWLCILQITASKSSVKLWLIIFLNNFGWNERYFSIRLSNIALKLTLWTKMQRIKTLYCHEKIKEKENKIHFESWFSMEHSNQNSTNQAKNIQWYYIKHLNGDRINFLNGAMAFWEFNIQFLHLFRPMNDDHAF